MFKKIYRKRNNTGYMVLFQSISGYFSNILTIISGILVAKWLLPEELGFFNLFNVITSYIILSQMGIPSGLSREFPYFMGKGDMDKSVGYAAAAQFFGLFLGSLILIISIIISLILILEGKNDYAAGVIIIGSSSFQTLYVTKYLKILFRSNNEFNKLAVLNIINSVVLFAGVYFVYLYGFYGLCLRTFIGIVIDLLLTFYLRPVKVKPKYSQNDLIDLVKVGFPIYSVASVYALWPIFQRTIVVAMGGTLALGLFAIPAMVQTSLSNVTNSISSVSFPKMSYLYGKNNKFIEILKFPVKLVIFTMLGYLFLTFIGWFLIPLFINNFLPNYSDGIEAVKWMLIVGLLANLSVFSNVYMVIKKNFDRLKTYLVGFTVWGFFLIYHFLIIKSDFRLELFPQALILGYITTFLVDLFYFRKYSKALN